MYRSESPDIDGAGLHGTLNLRDGCLLVTTDPDSQDYVVVFGFGTTWLPEIDVVRFPGGDALEVGSEVVLGGGGYGVDAR